MARPRTSRMPSARAGLLVGILVAACQTAAPASTTGPVTAAPSPDASTTGSTEAPATTVPATTVPATEAPATAAPPTDAPPTAEPTPTANTSPRIVTWDVPRFEDCTGATAGSIHVSWSVVRATGVTISIDGPGIYDSYGKSGETDIPFGCDMTELDHTYTLRTAGGSGPAASRTETVAARPPSILSFTLGVPDCGGPDQFDGIPMSYEIRAATGATLQRDGADYSTYNTKLADDIVLYDCMKEFQTFRLTTTGGYGDEAHEDVIVNRPQH